MDSFPLIYSIAGERKHSDVCIYFSWICPDNTVLYVPEGEMKPMIPSELVEKLRMPPDAELGSTTELLNIAITVAGNVRSHNFDPKEKASISAFLIKSPSAYRARHDTAKGKNFFILCTDPSVKTWQLPFHGRSARFFESVEKKEKREKKDKEHKREKRSDASPKEKKRDRSRSAGKELVYDKSDFSSTLTIPMKVPNSLEPSVSAQPNLLVDLDALLSRHSFVTQTAAENNEFIGNATDKPIEPPAAESSPSPRRSTTAIDDGDIGRRSLRRSMEAADSDEVVERELQLMRQRRGLISGGEDRYLDQVAAESDRITDSIIATELDRKDRIAVEGAELENRSAVNVEYDKQMESYKFQLDFGPQIPSALGRFQMRRKMSRTVNPPPLPSPSSSKATPEQQAELQDIVVIESQLRTDIIGDYDKQMESYKFQLDFGPQIPSALGRFQMRRKMSRIGVAPTLPPSRKATHSQLVIEETETRLRATIISDYDKQMESYKFQLDFGPQIPSALGRFQMRRKMSRTVNPPPLPSPSSSKATPEQQAELQDIVVIESQLRTDIIGDYDKQMESYKFQLDFGPQIPSALGRFQMRRKMSRIGVAPNMSPAPKPLESSNVSSTQVHEHLRAQLEELCTMELNYRAPLQACEDQYYRYLQESIEGIDEIKLFVGFSIDNVIDRVVLQSNEEEERISAVMIADNYLHIASFDTEEAVVRCSIVDQWELGHRSLLAEAELRALEIANLTSARHVSAHELSVATTTLLSADEREDRSLLTSIQVNEYTKVLLSFQESYAKRIASDVKQRQDEVHMIEQAALAKREVAQRDAEQEAKRQAQLTQDKAQALSEAAKVWELKLLELEALAKRKQEEMATKEAEAELALRNRLEIAEKEVEEAMRRQASVLEAKAQELAAQAEASYAQKLSELEKVSERRIAALSENLAIKETAAKKRLEAAEMEAEAKVQALEKLSVERERAASKATADHLTMIAELEAAAQRKRAESNEREVEMEARLKARVDALAHEQQERQNDLEHLRSKVEKQRVETKLQNDKLNSIVQQPQRGTSANSVSVTSLPPEPHNFAIPHTSQVDVSQMQRSLNRGTDLRWSNSKRALVISISPQSISSGAPRQIGVGPKRSAKQQPAGPYILSGVENTHYEGLTDSYRNTKVWQYPFAVASLGIARGCIHFEVRLEFAFRPPDSDGNFVTPLAYVGVGSKHLTGRTDNPYQCFMLRTTDGALVASLDPETAGMPYATDMANCTPIRARARGAQQELASSLSNGRNMYFAGDGGTTACLVGVTVDLSPEHPHMSFSINGYDCGEAFSFVGHPDPEPLFPVVVFTSAGDRATYQVPSADSPQRRPLIHKYDHGSPIPGVSTIKKQEQRSPEPAPPSAVTLPSPSVANKPIPTQTIPAIAMQPPTGGHLNLLSQYYSEPTDVNLADIYDDDHLYTV